MQKLSLITVAYNSASTLRGTILSVLSQDYSDLEYIIVDGGSKDDSVSIIKSLDGHAGHTIKWVSEPDRGLYDAMNKGIAMATGDVIGIINSDDFFTDTDSVSRAMKPFQENTTLDAVYADVQYVNPVNLDKVVRRYSSAIIRPSLFRWGFMPAHATFYAKRELFLEHGNYQLGYKIAADFELLMRFMYKHRINTKYLPFTMVTMRTGGLSTSGLKSRYVLNKEIIKACKMNGAYTNMFMLSFKYLVKVFELRW